MNKSARRISCGKIFATVLCAWLMLAVLMPARVCAQGTPVPATLPPDFSSPGDVMPDNSYVLGVGDEVRVNVYGETDLSNSYKVDQSGMISMPLIGAVRVQGLSLRAAERLVTEKLADGYLVDPSVSMQVAEHRPFYILGEVHAPGSYNYVSNMTILNAVALAGGFTYRANRDNADILKAGTRPDSEYQKIPIEAVIAPGDIIVIKERWF